MELVHLLLAFMAGMTGAVFFIFGFILGRYTDSSTFKLKKDEADTYDSEIMDEEFFERAQLSPDEGGLEFPSDAELQQLREHNQ